MSAASALWVYRYCACANVRAHVPCSHSQIAASAQTNICRDLTTVWSASMTLLYKLAVTASKHTILSTCSERTVPFAHSGSRMRGNKSNTAEIIRAAELYFSVRIAAKWSENCCRSAANAQHILGVEHLRGSGCRLLLSSSSSYAAIVL